MRIKIIFLLLTLKFVIFAENVKDNYIDVLLGNTNRISVMYNSLSSITKYNDNRGFYIIDPDLSVFFNTAYPYTINDGALWQGRGISSELSGGIEYISPSFQVRVYPKIWWTQNLDFDLITTTQSDGYGHYWGALDSLQRYGDVSYYNFDLGQSDVRFNYKNYFTFGLSNENITLGSAKINPLLLSDNAAGFLHVDYGTNGIINTPIGGVEVRIINGRLEESYIFDEDNSNNYGFIMDLILAMMIEILW